ncbi:retrovirus-related pol polyprotein from transposon TNT 1-94 [Tanacetum coccineum]
MLTRSKDAKLTAVSSSEYLFAEFLFEIEPKKVFEAQNIRGGNKKDELGTVTRNKIRLVAQGYSKEERIDYDETFTPVARMEAIKIFLAFATHMNFKVFHMDVKSAFLNRKLKEEVYVKQPPSFESSEFPDYVCKLDKALYGPKKHQGHGDVLLIQVYVDDIIFGSINYKLCKQFEKLITKKFEMSMIGKLTYFLGFQINSLVKTLMVPPNNLGLGLAGKRANPKESHLISEKRIFRLCLLQYEQKSTLGACQMLGGKLVCCSAKKEQSVAMSFAKAEYVAAAAGCCANILWMKKSTQRLRHSLQNGTHLL